MSVTQNINQFKQGQAPGDLDLSYFGAENVIDCRFDPTDTTNTVDAGEGVILKDCGADDVAGPPIVGIRSGDTIAIFGVRIRSLKDSKSGNTTTYNNPLMRVAVRGAVMWFKATEALARGVKVTLDTATPGNVKAASTKAYLGYTLDKVALGGMVRVMLECDAMTAGS